LVYTACVPLSDIFAVIPPYIRLFGAGVAIVQVGPLRLPATPLWSADVVIASPPQVFVVRK
jgi:hypothetical protein